MNIFRKAWRAFTYADALEAIEATKERNRKAMAEYASELQEIEARIKRETERK